MEEKEIDVNGEKIKMVYKLSKDYIEDNSLKVFLDDTVDLEEVVSEINNDKIEADTDEIEINE